MNRPFLPLPLAGTQASDAALATRIEVVTRAGLARFPRWALAFGHACKGHRYYELVEDTICPNLDYRYLVVLSDERACAFQPFFLIDQDLLAGLGTRFGRIIAPSAGCGRGSCARGR